MVEQVLGAHQDQRLGEGPVHLAAQHVEQLRRYKDGVKLRHPHIATGRLSNACCRVLTAVRINRSHVRPPDETSANLSGRAGVDDEHVGLRLGVATQPLHHQSLPRLLRGQTVLEKVSLHIVDCDLAPLPRALLQWQQSKGLPAINCNQFGRLRHRFHCADVLPPWRLLGIQAQLVSGQHRNVTTSSALTPKRQPQPTKWQLNKPNRPNGIRQPFARCTQLADSSREPEQHICRTR